LGRLQQRWSVSEQNITGTVLHDERKIVHPPQLSLRDDLFTVAMAGFTGERHGGDAFLKRLCDRGCIAVARNAQYKLYARSSPSYDGADGARDTALKTCASETQDNSCTISYASCND
jgi:hypothetical protein